MVKETWIAFIQQILLLQILAQNLNKKGIVNVSFKTIFIALFKIVPLCQRNDEMTKSFNSHVIRF